MKTRIALVSDPDASLRESIWRTSSVIDTFFRQAISFNSSQNGRSRVIDVRWPEMVMDRLIWADMGVLSYFGPIISSGRTTASNSSSVT